MKHLPINHFNTISAFHKMSGLPKPEYPLVSLVDYSLVDYQTNEPELSWVQDFYSIGLKHNIQGKFKYGQQQYDFDEGLLSFVAPGQVVRLAVDKPEVRPSGFLLFIHPDFLWHTPMAKNIKNYDFFGYAVSEALFMSEKEEAVITELMCNIQREYHSNIDVYSQTIIISQIELLLNYCERFYQRQFITRKINNHLILDKLEQILEEYFANENLIGKGLPNVQYIADKLNISPNYLGTLLKTLTQKTTKEHIQHRLLEKAKEHLSTSQLTIAEIAYSLGFEHPQSFSKFFKNKALKTPQEFRAAFN